MDFGKENSKAPPLLVESWAYETVRQSGGWMVVVSMAARWGIMCSGVEKVDSKEKKLAHWKDPLSVHLSAWHLLERKTWERR